MDARYVVTPSPTPESPQVPEVVCLVQNGQKKAPPQRQQWSRKLEFVLSSLGYAVGFGNIWRFPYLLYRYGGGTFLIPYLIFVFITGVPLMTLEMSVAQFAGLGPFNIYDEMCPAMKGLGVTTFLTSFVNSIQYVQLLAYVVYYFFASFSLDLPWTNCDNSWNPNGCIGPCKSRIPTDGRYIWLNQTCHSVCTGEDPFVSNKHTNSTWVISFCQDKQDICNLTQHGSHCSGDQPVTCTLFGSQLNCSSGGVYTNSENTFPTNDYFYRKVLDLYQDGSVATWESYGYMVWPVFGCVIASYLLTGSALIQGIQTSGKVVYFTAIFPYAILTVLFFYGIMLPGASEGIKFYLMPDIVKLGHPEVWYEALSQVFFSLSIGYGGLMTLSSYNHFDTPVVSYATMISIMNFLTSFFAGFIVFSVLGYIAHETNSKIDEVAGAGLSLTFVTFPTALSKMSLAPLWSILFFVMLVTVGIDTQMADMETQLTAFFDQYPWLRKKKPLVVLGVTCAGVIGATSMSFQGGVWMMTLLNDYAATAPVLVVALSNSIVFCYIYGYKRVFADMERMVGPIKKVTRWYYTITWTITAPLSVFVCLMYFWGTFEGSKYDRPESKPFPSYINMLGVACTVFLFIIIPIGMVFMVIKGKREGKSVKDMFRPTKDWMSQEERRQKGADGA